MGLQLYRLAHGLQSLQLWRQQSGISGICETASSSETASSQNPRLLGNSVLLLLLLLLLLLPASSSGQSSV
jgi:hypothetical protein